jgi:D-alanyl-D-alanine carboxypeptidase
MKPMHRTVTVLLAATVAAAAGAAPVGAVPGTGDRTARPNAVRHELDALVTDTAVPGALAHSGHGRRGRTYTAGVANSAPGGSWWARTAGSASPASPSRITATTVMRLVTDGELGLDDPAGRYVLDISLAQGPRFAPGTDWGYSNTNHLVLGLVIERVTGEDFRAYVERSVIEPLGLRNTYWPAPGELGLRGPHAHNYGVHPLHPQDGAVDATELPGHEFGASAGLVSTPEDLNTFWDGLFGGRLLPGRAVRLMTRDTTDVGDDGYPEGSRYGYGVRSNRLSCGGECWGHLGDLPGDSVAAGHADKGRGTLTVYITTHHSTNPASAGHLQAAVDAAFCAAGRP